MIKRKREDYLSCALYNDRNDDQDDDQDDQDDQDDDRAHLSCALDDDRAERLQRGKRVVALQPDGEYCYKGDKDKRLERGYNQYHKAS